MELTSDVFCDPEFDCFAWLEEAMIEGHGSIPQLVELVPQLSLLSQTLNKSIHGRLHQLTIAGPQLQGQLDMMQRMTVPLAQQLDTTVSNISAGKKTSKSRLCEQTSEGGRDLKMLLTLHDAKQRLQVCSKALVEAARWEKNVRACAASIEGVATSTDVGNTTILADHVKEMQSSLAILKDMPGGDDRKRTMERLCVQIEAAVKPKLDEYLQESQLPVANVRSCLAVFSSIGRPEVVEQAYCRCRPAQLHRLWYSYSTREETEMTDESVSLSQWLESTFYDRIVRLLQREMENTSTIFGGPPEAERVLLLLFQNALGALTDSFRDRLQLVGKTSIEAPIQAFQVSCTFATQVSQVFYNNSSHMDNALTSKILTTIFAPYHYFFINFAEWASQTLTPRLLALVPVFVASDTRGAEDENNDLVDASVSTTGDAVQKYAQQLEDISKDIWTAVENVFRLCYVFTAGASFPDAIRATERSMKALMTAVGANMPMLRQSLGLDSASPAHGLLMTDWSQFHGALVLLRACGTIAMDLDSLERQLSVRVGEEIQTIFGGRGDSRPSSASSSPRSRRKEMKRQLDGMSIASITEPSRLVPTIAMLWLKEDGEREHEVLSFAHDVKLQGEMSNRPPMFAQIRDSLMLYTHQVQTLTYDTVFIPIAKVLEKVPSLPSWAKPAPSASSTELPTFSTLPQEYITLVADLLLSLLPQLEPFAESNNLANAAAASRDAGHFVCQREWEILGTLLHLTESELALCSNIFSVDENETDTLLSAADFVDLWTCSVASGAFAAFIAAVCRIPSLTVLGARQLEADVSYFQNVLSALHGGGSIERNFLIHELHQALEMTDNKTYSDYINELKSRTLADTNVNLLKDGVVLKFHELLAQKRQKVASAT